MPDDTNTHKQPAAPGQGNAPGYVTPLLDHNGQDVGRVLHASPDYTHYRMRLSKREMRVLLVAVIALFVFMFWAYESHNKWLAVIAVPLAAFIIVWLLVFDYNRRAANARVTVTGNDIFVHWLATDAMRVQRDRDEKLIVRRRGEKWLLRDHRANHGRMSDYRLKVPVDAFPNLLEFLRANAADSVKIEEAE